VNPLLPRRKIFEGKIGGEDVEFGRGASRDVQPSGRMGSKGGGGMGLKEKEGGLSTKEKPTSWWCTPTKIPHRGTTANPKTQKRKRSLRNSRMKNPG